MSHFRGFLLFALATLALVAAVVHPTDPAVASRPAYVLPASEPVAFVDVNVVPMDRERILPHQTVIVREGVIAAMGPKDDVPLPSGIATIDGSGHYLMPGLADMHIHLATPEDLLLYLANGITTVRHMWGFPELLQWREAVRAGERIGPHLYIASPGFDGQASWPRAILLHDPRKAEAAVKAQAAQGYDFIKVYSSLEPSVYHAIVAAAARQGMLVVGHVPNRVGLDQVLTVGQASIEHLGGYAARARTTNGTLDTRSLEALAQQTAAQQVWNTPTLTVQSRTPADVEWLRTQPYYRYVSPDQKRFFEHPLSRPFAWNPAPHLARLREVVQALHAAEAPLLLGTDAGVRYVLPGYAIHEEMAALRTAGLSPFAVLQMGTVNAARFLGQAENVGTVAIGQRADLLLLRANPLDKLAHLKAPAGVMVAGAWYTADVLTAHLEALAQKYAGGEEEP